MILCMPHWHVTLHGPVLHLVHSQPDEELDRVGSWDITLWRGAPSWDSHPELEHAALGIPLPALHASFIRHPWRFDIPDTYVGRKNTGELREFMVLTGGSWTLVLQFPRQAPAEVFAAVARGFHATLDIETTQKGPRGERGDEAGDRSVKPAEGVERAEVPQAAAGEGLARTDSRVQGPADALHLAEFAPSASIPPPPAARRLSRAARAAL